MFRDSSGRINSEYSHCPEEILRVFTAAQVEGNIFEHPFLPVNSRLHFFMEIKCHNCSFTFCARNVMKEYARENDHGPWDRVYLEVVVENYGSAIFRRFQIDDDR